MRQPVPPQFRTRMYKRPFDAAIGVGGRGIGWIAAESERRFCGCSQEGPVTLVPRSRTGRDLCACCFPLWEAARGGGQDRGSGVLPPGFTSQP